MLMPSIWNSNTISLGSLLDLWQDGDNDKAVRPTFDMPSHRRDIARRMDIDA
jgi:hypothetical protein